MKRCLILLFTLLLTLPVLAHPWKPRYYIIIDTDAGIDDMKAISMFLASPDVRVLAITVSPGVLDAQTAYIKVKSMLNGYYHEGIPVGINKSCSYKSPVFPPALNAVWGDEKPVKEDDPAECIALMNEIVEQEKNRIIMVCLGGLSTASAALSDIPQFKNMIKQIIWSSDGINDKKGFNYNIDSKAVDKVVRSRIPLTAVAGDNSDIFYDSELTADISSIHNIYSKRIADYLFSEIGKRHNYSYTLNDDAIPVYLHYPGLFLSDTTAGGIEAMPGELSKIREKTIKILKGETVDKNQVVKEFPVTPSFYFADVEPSVSDIINKYGIDEWVSGVIANELHRHLGVFAVIGVKMGIRAREYFNTGVDEFSVTSSAGSMPPLSCMNDGLQVSTGATPGHGLLTVKNESPAPSAEFTYMNRKIRLTLKPEIASLISNELREINFVYGLDSDIYWELVRKNTIRYWLKLDRHDIFNIERL